MSKPGIAEEIRKALDAATPGPWEWYEDEAEVVNSDGMSVCQLWWKDGKPRPHDDCIPDGILIANAPTWLRTLLEERDGAQIAYTRRETYWTGQLQQLREELEHAQKMYDQVYDDREKIRAERERLYLELAEKDKVLESVDDEIDNSIEMLREDAFENWDEAVNVLTSASRSIRSILSKYAKEEETK